MGDKKTNSNIYQYWVDFIEANILQCFTLDHTFTCSKMIENFDLRFKNETVKAFHAEQLQIIWNKLHTKQSIILNEDEALRLKEC